METLKRKERDEKAIESRKKRVRRKEIVNAKNQEKLFHMAVNVKKIEIMAGQVHIMIKRAIKISKTEENDHTQE
ncbi:unnamed protein product [Microthlaspi erraticum]|uniref:Uncharacterized protein n=1 Tax=Microthlaspi erraticum TaxID=1685480 RepID=A0A6D2IRF5_9BRAS|nr:unnamed protein product [Microthlaspi erraticum]